MKQICEGKHSMRGRGLEKIVNQVIGKNVTSIRKNKNLSQTDIAKILDMSFQQIQKYENASNRISASNLFLLSQALRVPIEDFFDGIRIDLEGKNNVTK
jgi:transcriptional regulator with XRE-family HTH domain